LLLTPEQIRDRVRELGEEITETYRQSEPVMVVVMQGAIIFFADLVREIKLPTISDAICVSSYLKGTTASQEPQLLLPPQHDWRDRDVIFVEAIVDTGKTAALLSALSRDRMARTARLCALLDKPSRRVRDVVPDYVGFTIPDLFVVGYGLDYKGQYRNLPGIDTLTVEAT